MGRINQIEKKLERWKNDLNPTYHSKTGEFFGRLIRKFKSGVLKVGHWLLTHHWETKQERYLDLFHTQMYEIDRLFENVKRDSPRGKALKRQVKKIRELCDLLLQKKDKVNIEEVYYLKSTLDKYTPDKN